MDRSAAAPTALDALSNLLRQRIGPNGAQTGSVEDLFTEIWREARTGGNIRVDDDEWPASELLSGLTTHLASVCGGIHVRRGSGLWHKYTDFLSDLHPESRTLTVITFNYDLLLEQILDDIGLRFDHGAPGTIEFDDDDRRRRLRRSGPHLQVLKLHGSANWGVCRGCRKAGEYVDLVVSFEKPYPAVRRKTCPWCGDRFLESGIIPPILGKAGESRHMEPVWLSARKALRRARQVVVIGYSLPVADVEAVSLLREVEGSIKRPRITVVCGPRGAPPAYQNVFRKFEDRKQYFEDFVEA